MLFKNNKLKCLLRDKNNKYKVINQDYFCVETYFLFLVED